MSSEPLDLYRKFVVNVDEYLTWVFDLEGRPKGNGRVARRVLKAIRDDRRALREQLEGLPVGAGEPPRA